MISFFGQLRQILEQNFNFSKKNLNFSDKLFRLVMQSFERDLQYQKNLPGWNQVVEIVQDVPPLPTTIEKALRLIQDGEHVSLRQLTAILEKDSGIASKILKVANSALFNRTKEVSNLLTATTVIGLKTLKGILISTSLKDIFLPETDFLKFSWRKSAICCVVLRSLSGQIKGIDPEDAATLGILHNLGELVLGSHKEYKKICSKSFEKAKLEKEVVNFILEDSLGFKPSLVTALLSKKWNFPDNLCWHILHKDSPIDLLGWSGQSFLMHLLFQAVTLMCELCMIGINYDSISVRLILKAWKGADLPIDLCDLEKVINTALNETNEADF
ncbi:MAG: HDOD domain-containing protein [Deltaproteobacteria bacterium]|nr:HDOD domain-containing protein [Deltaproteobacteria bacterium]